MLTRIRQLNCGIYVIDEQVTPNGLYITWPEYFVSYKSAKDFLETYGL